MVHKCRFCGKTFDKGIKLGGHVVYCKSNPNRNENRRKLSESLKGIPLTESARKILSVAMKLAVKEGRHRVTRPGGCRKICPYTTKSGESVKFHSSWEVSLAQFLDSKNEVWERSDIRFPYLWNEGTHYYTPDFYIPRLDAYIEVKGYERERDRIKWKAFDKKLLIVKGRELKDLDRWFSSLI